MRANEVIRMRRKELGMTMKEVANAVGVSEGTVSRWESGDIRNMRRDKIAILARVLDVTPAVLMDWEEYDAELAERKKISSEFVELSNVADLENLRIAIDLIKRLENRK